uniref:Uncharacterized protein n=1 Tax=Populus alba TaxID=43335 RepID=A0A4U5N8Y2_POPAL|nr:hypothetical protein D5086_0000273670 [Populus alba]
MDPGKKRHNELRYEQELRRDIVLESGFPCCIVFCSSFTLFKTLAISFSTMTLFTRIAPPYGSSLLYAGLQNRICLSLGCSFSWPQMGPFASWCCAWLETTGLVAGIGTQAYAGSQTLQSIILLSTGTNKNGGYFAPKWLFLCMYIGLTLIWAVLNTFALEVIAFIDVISIWWVIGGLVIVTMLPLVALTTKSASCVLTHFEMAPEPTGISNKPYAVIFYLSLLLSILYMAILLKKLKQSFYCLPYGAHFSSEGSQSPPMQLVCHLYSSWTHYLESQRSLHFHNFHMYNWMGWRLCSSNLCKNGNGRAHFTSVKQGGHFASLPFCGFVSSVFLLPTYYPISWDTFNYAPVALVTGLILIMLWRVLDARELFKGPVRNFDNSKREGISSVTNSTLDVFIGTP